MDTLTATAYNLLCVNLGYPPSSVPDGVKTYLQHTITAAQSRLSGAGTLDFRFLITVIFIAFS